MQTRTHQIQGWNLYTYVGNQPLNHTDPLGLWKEVDLLQAKGNVGSPIARKTLYRASLRSLMFRQTLNKHFQNPTIHIGNWFDVSGFFLSNPVTVRDEGPAVVQVFLESKMRARRSGGFTSVGESLKRHWSSHNVDINAGVSKAELDSFEAKHHVVLPEDLRDYFFCVNGMPQQLDLHLPRRLRSSVLKIGHPAKRVRRKN